MRLVDLPVDVLRHVLLFLHMPLVSGCVRRACRALHDAAAEAPRLVDCVRKRAVVCALDRLAQVARVDRAGRFRYAHDGVFSAFVLDRHAVFGDIVWHRMDSVSSVFRWPHPAPRGVPPKGKRWCLMHGGFVTTHVRYRF